MSFLSIIRPIAKSAAFAFLAPLLASGAARAEIIPLDSMVRGISSSPAQCAAIETAVWVSVANRGFCMRYYLSTAGGQGAWPVVYLSGDKLGTVDLKTRRIKVSKTAKDEDTRNFQRNADQLSRLANGPAIYLARVGIDGSSGHHSIRRSVLELYVTHAALNAIKQKYQLDGFHLVGQSGGSAILGGLLALRNDIGCAVPGAGRLAFLKQRSRPADPLLLHIDPSQAIPAIARNGARIIVVTDPADQTVQVQHQSTFVQQMRRHGAPIEQLLVQATDEKRHGVSAYARQAVAACSQGQNTQRIAQDVATLVQHRLEIAARRQASGNLIL